MSPKQWQQASRFLSYVLRHRPEDIGLTLDSDGWADVDSLCAQSSRHGRPLTREQLTVIVASDEKARYALSEDGQCIRAVQGHSTPQVDIVFAAQTPPDELYHGTAMRFLADIIQQGLLPRTRQYVHLSDDKATAIAVGRRHGSEVVLHVDCAAMLDAGHRFYRAENGVWLVKAVPPPYLQVSAGPSGS